MTESREIQIERRLVRIETMLEELHELHQNGGCPNLRVLCSAFTWFRVAGMALVGAAVSWLGFIHVKLERISETVARIADK